jgi:hypothetical protein
MPLPQEFHIRVVPLDDGTYRAEVVDTDYWIITGSMDGALRSLMALLEGIPRE